MEQLSLPYRIALVGLLVFGALYLLVLKPKGDTAPVAPLAVATSTAAPSTGPTLPGVKGLTRAIDKAKGAVATQAASDAATQAATGGTPTAAAKPATAATIPHAAPAKPRTSAAARSTSSAISAAAGDPSRAILAELRHGHTAVLLFAGTQATDDRAVGAAVRGLDRRGGKVDVHVIPIARVGAYEAITRGVAVMQAPTVLVIGRHKQAHPVIGFTTTAELNQLVADVRRSG